MITLINQDWYNIVAIGIIDIIILVVIIYQNANRS